MSIFSLVIVGIIAKCIDERRQLSDIIVSLTSISILLELGISVGYFIRVGSFEVGFSEAVIILDTFFCMVYLVHRKRVDKRAGILGTLLLGSAMISLFLLIVAPYSGAVVQSAEEWDYYYFHGVKPVSLHISLNQVKEFMHLFCYVILFTCVFSLEREKVYDILKKTQKGSKIFLTAGIAEILFVYILNKQELLTAIEKKIFGESYFTDGSLLSIGYSNRLRGLKSEPSMYAYTLFVFGLIFLIGWLYQKNKNDRKWFLLSMILMILTKSFSAVLCMGLVVVYVLIFHYKNTNSAKKLLYFIISVVIIGISFAALVKIANTTRFDSYYLERIRKGILSMTDLSIGGWTGDYATYDGSTKVRLISIVGTWAYVLKRPFFGLALGSTYAHSTMITVLASLGWVGTLIWVAFTFYLGKNKKGIFYTIVCTIHVLALILFGNGFFPFYGVQNILIIELFDIYASKSQYITNA